MQRQSAKPDVISCNAAISACEKGAQPERTLKLLREMQQRSLEPNVISYNAAISACQKGPQPEQALQLLRAMQQQSVEPDVISYNALFSAGEKGARPEQALGLLCKMEWQSVEPPVFSYTVAFSTCEITQFAAARRWPHILLVLVQMVPQDWEGFFSSWCFHRLIQQAHPGHRPQVGSGISCRCPSPPSPTRRCL